MIAYASRSLTFSERNYRVIQHECLAIVFALKQFRHYLLGRSFQIHTDHEPLQWLTLAMQEYDFTIVHRKGSANTNADALSRLPPPSCALTVALPHYSLPEFKKAKMLDPIISVVHKARLQSSDVPLYITFNRGILRRYKQLWKQLAIADGVLCPTYSLEPLEGAVILPILPPSFQQEALTLSHDIPTAGHLGIDKTLDRLRRNAYWVSMARDVERYCRNCTICQKSKLSLPPSPLQNMPIGQPWQMVAVDILQVPLSTTNNLYLLILQDYFTKWADAIPLPDKTANRIATEMVKFFCTYGPPLSIHSDQGRNFESTI